MVNKLAIRSHHVQCITQHAGCMLHCMLYTGCRLPKRENGVEGMIFVQLINLFCQKEYAYGRKHELRNI